METAVDRSELISALNQECCSRSYDIQILSRDGKSVSINFFVLQRFSKETAKLVRKNSSIFMDEDLETILLLRDILTFGEGRSSGESDQIITKLMSASRSLNIELSDNFEVNEANMTMNNFISGVDDMMRSRYVVEKVDEEEKDVYNMSTEIFIDKIDEIFTSTLKKDALDQMFKANNEAIAKVSVDRSYECGFCSKAFSSESKLMKHEICHTQFRCNTCGKGFRMQTLLTFHMNEHKVNSDEETLEEQTTTDQSSLNVEESINETGEFACKHCDRIFKSKKKLVNHSLCHTNSKCSICMKGFRMPTLLSRHMKIEHGIISDSFNHSSDNSHLVIKNSKKSKKHSFIAAIKTNLNI